MAFGVGMFCFLSPDTNSEVTSTKDTIDKRDIVEIGGVKCVPKDGIETYLFLGIDQRGELTKVKKFDGTGQCDVIQLLVLDNVNKTYDVLSESISYLKSQCYEFRNFYDFVNHLKH